MAGDAQTGLLALKSKKHIGITEFAGESVAGVVPFTIAEPKVEVF